MSHNLVINTMEAKRDGLEHNLLKFLFSRPPEFGWDHDIKYEIHTNQKIHCLDGVLFDDLPFVGEIMMAAGSIRTVETVTVDKTVAEVLGERRFAECLGERVPAHAR